MIEGYSIRYDCFVVIDPYPNLKKTLEFLSLNKVLVITMMFSKDYIYYVIPKRYQKKCETFTNQEDIILLSLYISNNSVRQDFLKTNKYLMAKKSKNDIKYIFNVENFNLLKKSGKLNEFIEKI